MRAPLAGLLVMLLSSASLALRMRGDSGSARAAQIAIKRALEEGSVQTVKVFAAADLRGALRARSAKRRAKVFVDTDRRSDVEQLRNEVAGALHLGRAPFRLLSMAPQLEDRIVGGDEAALLEADGEEVASAEDLEQVWDTALSRGNKAISLLVSADASALPTKEVPAWLRDMPDPMSAPHWSVLSFFAFESIEEPEEMCAALRRLWRPFGARGRVYVAPEGVNAQMCVPSSVVDRFEEACRSVPQLGGIVLNADHQMPIDDPPFRALHIRSRHQVLADGLEQPLDWSQSGREVDAAEWHELVSSAGSGEGPAPIILDCRNGYETEVGRFEGAEPLNTTFFRDSWSVLERRLSDVDPDAPILTYCTGGIRCVKVNAYLEQELGFRNTARLAGGIVAYADHVEATGQRSTFRGANYVFDGRLSRRVTPDLVGECYTCGAKCVAVSNCANPKCHARMVQCEVCAAKYDACCSRGCKHQLAELQNPTPVAAAAAPAAPGSSVAASSAPRRLRMVGGAIELGAEEAAAASDALRQAAGGGVAVPTVGERDYGMHLLPQPFQSARLNRVFDDVLDAYVDGMSSAEPAHLARLRERLREDGALASGAHMATSASQGRLLKILCAAIGAEEALELGTFGGYGALCLAEGVGEGGRVTTVECDERAAAFARESFAAAPPEVAGRVEMRTERAAEAIEALGAEGRSFDVVYMDADKRSYASYLERILELGILRRNGLLFVDNTLFRGMAPLQAIEDAAEGAAGGAAREGGAMGKQEMRQRRLARAMHDFNEAVARDARVEQALLPMRDGFTVIRYKGGS